MKVKTYRSPYGGRSVTIGLLELYAIRSQRGRLWKVAAHLGRFTVEVSW